MKKLQIMALTMLFAISQTVNCSDMKSEYDNLDKYNINIQETIVDLAPGQPIPADTDKPVVIEDKVVNDYFTSNKVRTLITQETKNGKTIRTTTVSTTKNPTIFTWTNGALAAGAVAVGAAGLAYANGLNLDDINKAFGSTSSSFNLKKQNEAQESDNIQPDKLITSNPTSAVNDSPVLEAPDTNNVNTQTESNNFENITRKYLPVAAAIPAAYLGYRFGPSAGALVGGLGGTTVGGLGGAAIGRSVGGAMSGAVIGGATGVGLGTATGLIAGPAVGGYAGYKGGEMLAENIYPSSTQQNQQASA